ncbi:TonB-dependent receptor plug domain-containing protein [Lutimonas zeaxanthinifaciens]|uniref:TonB-dependent receptor plug domain-containing protein n=1 Tax=Lutimonas zeaxanthinifaciens TaxID=3060215 RepID=UPI00265CE6DE|nr:TonB-dependent receptor [Lutimonas sp. YSD2104]WKK67248.1 TonB-dependent receptor [Lutimonas sp. YSD2104]
MKKILLLLIICFGTIHAQNDSVNRLDEIVLRANFSPVVNSGYEVKVISDSILKNSYSSLGELLQKQANFYFKQNGYGMVSSISLRGTSASQTGVYWNGIGINSALNGQTDFNTIQANGFDELEVRKGGGSVLLGNGSIGGAVNLKDQVSFYRKKRIQVLGGAGSFGTYFGQVTGLFSTERFYTKVSGGLQYSENDYPYPGTELKNENGAFQNYNLNATFGYKLNEMHSVRLHTVVFENDRDLSRTMTVESNSRLKNTDRRLLFDWMYVGERFTSSFKAAYLHEDFTYFFDKNMPENISVGSSDRIIGKYDLSYFFTNNLFLKGGAEFENATGDGSNIDDATQNDFTAYVLMHHEPWERFQYNISLRAGASSAYSIPLIYSADAKYELIDKFSLRAAFSTNYRLPTFNDLYWEPGGNPDLKPEFSSSAEAGINYVNKGFRFSAAYYIINSEDLIQWRPVTQDFWRPQNVSKASSNGFETAVSYNRAFREHNLALRLSYDYTLAKDKELDKQLIYVPEHKAACLLDYSWKKWRFNYHLQYVGEVFITTSNSQSLDDYLLSDISFNRLLLKDMFAVQFKINNVFDTNYQSVAYRPMPGRNYVIQINFKL